MRVLVVQGMDNGAVSAAPHSQPEQAAQLWTGSAPFSAGAERE
jgi:hypothetical protein